MSSGDRTRYKVLKADRIWNQTQQHIMQKFNSCRRKPQKSQVAGNTGSNDVSSFDPGEGTPYSWVLNQYLDILLVWVAQQCPCDSSPAIFANGSSVGDLRSGETRQLERGEYKSPELSGERFTVYRGAIFEIESLIGKCWWHDLVEDLDNVMFIQVSLHRWLHLFVPFGHRLPTLEVKQQNTQNHRK